MYLALGFGIAAPTFVLAGEGVRRVITRMLTGSDTGPGAALIGRRADRQLVRT